MSPNPSLFGPENRLLTSRLVVRSYLPGDLDARLRLIRDGFDPNADREDIRRWLEWMIAGCRELNLLRQPPYGDYAVTLRATGETIGSVGLVPAAVPWGVFEEEAVLAHLLTPEFGLFWAIERGHRGKGYATEAAHAFANAVFDVLPYRRIVAVTERGNLASQAVMRKLGMMLHVNLHPEPVWCGVVGVMNPPVARSPSLP